MRKSKAKPKIFKKSPSADEIAESATRGQDISAYLTNKFTVVRAVCRVNVDFTEGMLRQLDQRAAAPKYQPASFIKTLLSRALEEGHASKPARSKNAD